MSLRPAYTLMIFIALVASGNSSYVPFPICNGQNEILSASFPCDATCANPTTYDVCGSSESPLVCRCPHGFFRNDDGNCVPLQDCPRERSNHAWTNCKKEQVMSAYPLIADAPSPDCDPATGNYMPVQCVYMAGVCFCVDLVTGTEIEGTVTNLPKRPNC